MLAQSAGRPAERDENELSSRSGAAAVGIYSAGTVASHASRKVDPDTRGASGALMRDDSARRFRILSPLDGDRYAIPAGIESRYATIAFRAGGKGADSVTWSVDGTPFVGGRWPLTPGRHVVRALSAGGEIAEARILVER
jgi:hypothetical protein